MSRASRAGRRLVIVASAAAMLAATAVPGVSATSPSYGITQPFVVSTNPYTFGQAPDFAPDGRVVFHQDFAQGDGEQIYLSNLDGSVKNITPKPK